MATRRHSRHLFVICAFLMALAGLPTAGGAAGASAAGPVTLDPNTQFYAPRPDHGAILQIAHLTASGQRADAALIRAMVNTPQAVWFTSGNARSVEQDVRQTVTEAIAHRTVPLLVAYDVPGRDCAQYSAGGAPTGDAYRAWIDGFATGLGDRQAIVLLEPDGLALLPTDCGQPDTYGRAGLINYAAHALLRDPNALVYLDAGHSAWHSDGDMAARLVQGGVLDVQGFFSNVSNFRRTEYETHFDTWISKCIAFGTDPEEGGWRLGHFDWCASQYYSPFGPVNPNDISTWHYSDQWFDANMGHAVPTTHFVVDTSRNGQGPWVVPPHPSGDPQDWCNPPDRGLGVRPTANTGVPLADAFLWVKTPGQSDGQCTRWGPAPTDPVRGIVDPPAGQWFPDMALELVRNANPPLH
jgi:endoglucanase